MGALDELSNLELIASGTYGRVFTARRKNGAKDNDIVIKLMDNLEYSYSRMSAFREVFILQHLQTSPYIVKMLSSCALVDGDSGHASSVYLTLERLDMDVAYLMFLARGGRSRFAGRWLEADWSTTGLYVLQRVLLALAHLHSLNILHRDVKPGNILVNIDDASRPIAVKLADFGLARPVDGDYSHDGYLTDAVTTRWYRAPELLTGRRSYSNTVDIWSAGCVFAEFLLQGRVLFPGENDTDQLQQISDAFNVTVPGDWRTADHSSPWSSHTLDEQLPSYVSPQDSALLKTLLTYNGAERPTASEVLRQPRLESLYDNNHPDTSTGTLQPLHIEDETLCLMAKSADGFIDSLCSLTGVEFKQQSERPAWCSDVKLSPSHGSTDASSLENQSSVDSVLSTKSGQGPG